MDEVVIVAAARSAFGRLGGLLAPMRATEIGAEIIRALLMRSTLPLQCVEEVMIGQAVLAGAGLNPARQAAMAAGLGQELPSVTINQSCGSGAKTLLLAAQSIRCGERSALIVGGMESMSQAPFLSIEMRRGRHFGHTQLFDANLYDAWTDPFRDYPLAMTAELLAERYKIDRETQDEAACESHRRAAAAQVAGIFREEIEPITVSSGSDSTLAVEDELIAAEACVESLARLKPSMRKEGSVTAGNSTQPADGAAMLLITSRQLAEREGVRPLAKLCAAAEIGLDPASMGLGPLYAIRKLLERESMSLDQIDLFEILELFAVQRLALKKELGIDSERLNVNGGAVAWGHPVGAAGARIVVSLLYEMQRRSSRYGVAALPVGGGMGLALLFESLATS